MAANCVQSPSSHLIFSHYLCYLLTPFRFERCKRPPLSSIWGFSSVKTVPLILNYVPHKYSFEADTGLESSCFILALGLISLLLCLNYSCSSSQIHYLYFQHLLLFQTHIDVEKIKGDKYRSNIWGCSN